MRKVEYIAVLFLKLLKLLQLISHFLLERVLSHLAGALKAK